MFVQIKVRTDVKRRLGSKIDCTESKTSNQKSAYKIEGIFAATADVVGPTSQRRINDKKTTYLKARIRRARSNFKTEKDQNLSKRKC